MRSSITRSWLCRKLVLAMAGTLFHSLVILLAFSQIFCLNAAPATRIGRLMHEPQVLPVPENNHMVAKEKSWEEYILNGRMTVELNDYPGSGANNRHTPTPKPQFSRCPDC